MSTSEQRGFALYVGMSESKARESGVELSAVADALRHEVTRRAPLAETHALAVVGPVGASPSDLDVVIRAVGDRAPEPEEPAGLPDPPVRIRAVIDLARHRVLIEKDDARLTFKELAILQVLVDAEGATVTREHLRRVIATGEETVNDRTIDVYIRRLRVKLGTHSDLIRTVHRQGYRFDPGEDVSILRS
jgi:hypothetical protein